MKPEMRFFFWKLLRKITFKKTSIDVDFFFERKFYIHKIFVFDQMLFHIISCLQVFQNWYSITICIQTQLWAVHT